MATLELGIDEDVAVGPVAADAPAGAAVLGGDRLDGLRFRRRGAGDRVAAAQSDRHGHAGAPGAGLGAALARHRRPRARRTGAADLWRADLAHGRPLRAGDRDHDRRRARHAGGLFPRPLRNAGRRQHGRAAGVSAADPGAGRDRLSRAIDPQSHLHSRRARHSRLHARGARGNADAGAARIRDRGAGARARRMRASCCASCCPMSFCRCSPSSCSASPSPSSSKARCRSSVSACRRRYRAGAA